MLTFAAIGFRGVIRREDLRGAAYLFGRFALPYWRSLSLLVLLSLMAAFLTALQPLVLAPALDVALLSHTAPARSLGELDLNNLGATLVTWLGFDVSSGGLPALTAVVGLFVGVATASALLSFATLQLMRWIRTGIASDIQGSLYRHTLSLSLPFFVANRVGDLSHRFVFDVISTAQTFDPIVKGLLESGVQVLIYGVVLFRTDPWLASAVAAVALLHIGITRVLQSRIRRASQDSFDAYGTLAGHVQEAFTAIRIVKSFGAEAFELQRLQRRLSGLKRIVLRYGFFTNSEAPLRQIADATAIGTALLVSFLALSSGRLTLAGFGLFVLVVRQTIGPFGAFGGAFVQLQQMLGASARLTEIFNQRPRVTDGHLEAPPLQRSLELRGVAFEYAAGNRVLAEIELEIRRGSVMAVVGPSGSGKSTLSDLLLRLHDPTAGALSWDGVDVRSFTQASYRKHFGVVPQEPLLFNTTIAENIAYGRRPDPDEVRRAALVAQADEFIRECPQGYETLVGDRGIRLSGGQRQRIAIARAVYGKPEILILDEATSSLDSESERLVQMAIDRVLEGATALVIAHRLSTVRRADTIVVLEAGRIVARGSHAELLETSTLYRRLHEAQFRDEALAS